MQPHMTLAPDKAIVLGKATIRAAHEMRLSNAALARVIGLSEPTSGSDAQKRHDWLRSHNKALNGTPAALIETPTGLVNALAYLDGMRAAA